MPNQKVTELTVTTTPSLEDLLYLVANPSTTPLDRAVALSSLKTLILTPDTQVGTLRVLTLTGNVTLDDASATYQLLNTNGTSRDLTLSTTSITTGRMFHIRNTDSMSAKVYIAIKQSTTTLDYLYPLRTSSFIFDGANWQPIFLTWSPINDGPVSIGNASFAADDGVAIGDRAQASGNGVAIGRTAQVALSYSANTGTVAIGYGSVTCTFLGVAIGFQCAAPKTMSTAIGGRYTSTTRVAEFKRNTDCTSYGNNIFSSQSTLAWAGITIDANPVEIFCGNESLERAIITALSACTFIGTAAARDNVSGDTASWKFEGSIKRDGAGNTILSVCTVTVLHRDDISWALTFAADDTNDALVPTFTGDATNPTHISIRADTVESWFN